MKVACIQMDVLHCRKQENLEKALHMALKAVRKGAELIVLPEVFSTGFCYEYFDHAAETLPSPLLENLACFSEANDCIIMGSVIEKVASEDTSNSGAPVDSKNSTISDSSNSPFYYELRFPEVARKLSLAGSDLLVTTAAFPNPRSEHWNILAKARAIENQIPHIACNRIGSAPDCSYFGNSMIIDAWGEVKADAGNKECVIVHDLDLSRKNEVRKMIPVFENRRIELYSEDLKII